MSTNTASLTNYHPKTPKHNISEYTDILHADRPLADHPMDLAARAAQFSPYAALVGHKDIVHADEDAMRTKIDLDHDIIIDTTFSDEIDDQFYPDIEI